MKKRLLALGLILAMLATSAFAVVPFDTVSYTRPTLSTLQNCSIQMKEAVQQENAVSRIGTLYSDMQDEYEMIYTMYSLATLKRYQNADSNLYAHEVSECYKMLVDAYEIMRSTMVTMFESQYEDVFRMAWGDAVVDSVLNSTAMTEDERKIEGQIAEKIAEYSRASAKPSAVIDGVRIALDKAKTSAQRLEIYTIWQRELGEIYLDLVDLRKQLSGDVNYLALAYKGFYREYSTQNARDLEKMVSETMDGLYPKLDRVSNADAADLVDLDMSMEDAVRIAASALIYVDQSLMDSYRVMKENRLYDMEYSDKKYPAGFTVNLPSYKTPFLYFQPSSDIDGLYTFFHEFGHFNQTLNSDMHEYWPGSVTDMDAAEVVSQALPLIVGGKMPMLIGEEAGTLLQEYSVDATLFSLITGCMVDEFEQFVYETKNLTVDRLNEKFGELTEKYGVPWDGTVWTQIGHIYESPGYYISYAVSAITAMELWEKFETNPQAGRESYLTAVDAVESGYRTLLMKARLRNPFSAPELLEKIRTLIEKNFSLLVDTYGHWAEEKVDTFSKLGVVSGYLGSDGRCYFRPDGSLTRAEFVKLLYNLSGGSEETFTEPFADVSDSDWFSSCVAWAAENGLVNGVSETKFDPNGTVTRQDMAVMLERFLAWNRKTLPESGENRFTDSDQIADYALASVGRLGEMQILNGLPDGRFDPQGRVTRAAAVSALYTTLEVLASDMYDTESVQTVTASAPIQAQVLSMMVH